MEKIHKLNRTIVLVGTVLLSLMSIVSHGLVAKSILGIGVMVICGITVFICTLTVKDDLKKALCITLCPTIGTFIYSGIQGGNAVTFLTNYVYLVMMSLYFDKRYIRNYAIPVAIIGAVCGIAYPPLIDGAGGTLTNALVKVMYFTFMSVLLTNSTGRGRALLDQTRETIENIKNKSNLANGISDKLNTTINECKSGVATMSAQSASISEAAGNIKQILDGLANITNNVSEKINAGAQAATMGVEKMDTLLELMNGIKGTTENAHDVVQEEYDVIETVKKEFSQIHSEIETLLASTEKNTEMIHFITESISKQDVSVNSVEEEIENISELSDSLKVHFAES